MYGVITSKLCGAATQMILLKNFLGLFYIIIKKIISGSKSTFENAELMDYKLQRVRLRRGGSYIKSPEWLLHKGATINPKNENDEKCFQYCPPLALNYNEITKKEFENIF